MHAQGDKITMLTAYDATFARLVDEAGVDCILVGDSLGMIVQGHSSTIPVTLDEMHITPGAWPAAIARPGSWVICRSVATRKAVSKPCVPAWP